MLKRTIKYVATILALVIPVVIWIMDVSRHKLTSSLLAATIVVFVVGLFNVYKWRVGKTSS